MAHVVRSHGGDWGNEPPYGPPYNLPTGCESCMPNFTIEVGKKSLVRLKCPSLPHYITTLIFNDITTPSTGKTLSKGSKRIVQTVKDRKTKLKKHFDKQRGYDDTERAKARPPEGMDPDAWVRVIEELFTTTTYQKRSQANSENHSKQLYESYHRTQSYAQRRYTEIKS
ncbi:hypothetical protein R6Q57_011160 [Mikania cordata]